MKGFNQAEQAMIDQLGQSPTFLSKVFGRGNALRVLLQKLEHTGSYSSIPYIFRLIFDGKRSEATQAAKTIHAIVSRKPWGNLLLLEDIIHGHSSSYWTRTANYPKLKPSSVKTLLEFQQYSATLVGMASFDANGYVRAAAIKAMGELDSGENIPYLLIRINDWVPQIRQAAYDEIRRRLTIENARYFVQNFDLVVRLSRCQRGNHEELIESIFTLLKEPQCLPFLHEELERSDSHSRRHCLQLLLENEKVEPASLLKKVAAHKDPLEFVMLAKEICRRSKGPALSQFYRNLNDVPFASVRLVFLKALVDWNAAECKEELWDALFDKDRLVREIARHNLMSIGFSQVDFAHAYRRIILEKSEPISPAIILGLSETGEPSDTDLLLPYLDHQQIAIKCTIIRALSVLSREKFRFLFYEQIGSEDSGVSKEARNAILKLPQHLIDIPILADRFQSATQEHERRNIIRVFSYLSKWDKLGLMLTVMSNGSAEEKALASRYLLSCMNFFNKSFLSPSPVQLERIKAHIDVLDEKDPTRQKIDWMIK